MTSTSVQRAAAGASITNGVFVADGYGLRVAVDKRHLIVSDGMGRQRRETRFARVGHGLRRLVIFGHSGTISLEALRWLDRVGVSFVHLDKDGRLLAASTQPGLDDARLRRAQAVAAGTDVGLSLTVDLLDAKLAGQASVARSHLRRDHVWSDIEALRAKLRSVDDIGRAREIEATAAAIYFTAWPGHVALTWARNDLPRIPEHWRAFTGRRSPLSTGSATRAADPINALLNYMYALAEIECRRACLMLGLDPGLGFLHVDAKGRDSLALDLIETVRPAIEAFVLDLADGHVFRFTDFVERDDGHCRILPPLTHRLAESLPQWEAVVAPWAEHIAHRLADASGRAVRKRTPLTSALRRAAAVDGSQGRRKFATARTTVRENASALKPSLGAACVACGTPLSRRQRSYCQACWQVTQRAAGIAGSQSARSQLTEPNGRSVRGTAIREGKLRARDERARSAGFAPNAWDQHIGPSVRALSLDELRRAIGISTTQASRIRMGSQIPDPKYWTALATAAAARLDRLNPERSTEP